LIDGILKDKNIANKYDLCLFTYHTKLTDYFTKSTFFRRGRLVNNSINDIAKLLSSSIKYPCAKYENIVLIGHSMGGLIAKKLILEDLKASTTSKIKLYISLATPHSGSNFAILGKAILGNP